MSPKCPPFSRFKAFCDTRNICLETSAPYHPESNGLAEVTVQEIKRLMKRCHETGEDFDEQLLAWRCLPLAAGALPAQAFLGRRPRTALPALATPLPDLDKFRERRHAQAAAHIHFDRPRFPLPPISSTVLVQDPKTKRWLKHYNARSAIIRFENGRQARRNRRHLKFIDPETPPMRAQPQEPANRPRPPPVPAQPQRPQRQR
ncbi:hypothetical protein TCAL_15002 [Tigriopus californicus]|uniref:Integrase catalytic domain-containing protein n=1 Tax=Tigriopus californicus TaxID=6832 RepID=A0A553NZH2_TIGCA|nr:uncharacterized protein LOC131886719 [Tigriopus californicus]TRY70825.1 hypothetical protein TCAL_15002 [Tigriopus californicus]